MGALTSTAVRCACGEELLVDEHHRASCSNCGRWGYFALVDGRPRKVGPWHSPRTRPDTRLPYGDR